jgi:CBS-domain-containing membrane protein
MPPTKPLLDLTAQDLMTRSVVAIPEAMSVRAAAHLLHQSHVSGAPVIDAYGRCVGVLSATDFMTIVEKGDDDAKRRTENPGCYHSAWQMLDAQELPTDEVRRFMTDDPVTVSPATPVAELARMMVDAHIHRVIVVDGEGRPVGIVATTDILAAVGRAGCVARGRQPVGV